MASGGCCEVKAVGRAGGLSKGKSGRPRVRSGCGFEGRGTFERALAWAVLIRDGRALEGRGRRSEERAFIRNKPRAPSKCAGRGSKQGGGGAFKG